MSTPHRQCPTCGNVPPPLDPATRCIFCGVRFVDAPPDPPAPPAERKCRVCSIVMADMPHNMFMPSTCRKCQRSGRDGSVEFDRGVCILCSRVFLLPADPLTPPECQYCHTKLKPVPAGVEPSSIIKAAKAKRIKHLLTTATMSTTGRCELCTMDGGTLHKHAASGMSVCGGCYCILFERDARPPTLSSSSSSSSAAPLSSIVPPAATASSSSSSSSPPATTSPAAIPPSPPAPMPVPVAAAPKMRIVRRPPPPPVAIPDAAAIAADLTARNKPPARRPATVSRHAPIEPGANRIVHAPPALSSSSSSSTNKRTFDAAEFGTVNAIEDDEAADTKPRCCVCMDAEPEVVCFPCGHLCMCQGCDFRLLEIAARNRERQKCPICNQRTWTCEVYTV